MSSTDNHETKPIINRIINNSCLTELEFISLIYKRKISSYSNLINIFNQYSNFLKKPSGEISTIRKRAKNNLRSCLLTLMILISMGIISEKNLIQLKEISDMIKNILNVENDEVYKKLDELLKAMIEEFF